MSIVVKYSDVAIGAKESFDITFDKALPPSNTSLVNTEAATFGRYDIPFELNSMILDGEADFLPEEGLAQIGFISDVMCGEDGEFETPITFELVSDENFASPGLQITFDENKNIYATHVRIKWFNGNLLLKDQDFYPNSAKYFFNSRTEFYNRVVFEFYSLNVPRNRLRVNHIDYGLVVEFSGDELKGAKIIQEIDPISSSIPINTFDFTVESKKNIEFSFQTKQPIKVFVDDQLRATAFVKSSVRKARTIWNIQSEDYIGLMDTIFFKGGMYYEKDALELIDEIFSAAKTPYSTDGQFDGIVLSGHIPYISCREALMQVVFAIGAIADTSNSEYVKIFRLDEKNIKSIPKNRILQGQRFQSNTRVTAVELMSHSYGETNDDLVVYDAEKSGTGSQIFVSFNEPLHDLSIENGVIVESGANHAVINAEDGCLLHGKKYEHTMVVKRKENPLILSTDIENVIAIENATLVSSINVDQILDRCYDYLVQTESVSMKIIDGRNDEKTNVGDLVDFDTEYLGEKNGRIIRQSFSLIGGVLVKDSEVR